MKNENKLFFVTFLIRNSKYLQKKLKAESLIVYLREVYLLLNVRLKRKFEIFLKFEIRFEKLIGIKLVMSKSFLVLVGSWLYLKWQTFFSSSLKFSKHF